MLFNVFILLGEESFIANKMTILPFNFTGRKEIMKNKIPRSDILIYRNAYAIMPVGKKDMTMFHVNKERTPVCTTNTCEGSSLFISVVEHPLGYSLSLL